MPFGEKCPTSTKLTVEECKSEMLFDFIKQSVISARFRGPRPYKNMHHGCNVVHTDGTLYFNSYIGDDVKLSHSFQPVCKDATSELELILIFTHAKFAQTMICPLRDSNLVELISYLYRT